MINIKNIEINKIDGYVSEHLNYNKNFNDVNLDFAVGYGELIFNLYAINYLRKKISTNNPIPNCQRKICINYFQVLNQIKCDSNFLNNCYHKFISEFQVNDILKNEGSILEYLYYIMFCIQNMGGNVSSIVEPLLDELLIDFYLINFEDIVDEYFKLEFEESPKYIYEFNKEFNKYTCRIKNYAASPFGMGLSIEEAKCDCLKRMYKYDLDVYDLINRKFTKNGSSEVNNYLKILSYAIDKSWIVISKVIYDSVTKKCSTDVITSNYSRKCVTAKGNNLETSLEALAKKILTGRYKK